MESDISLKTGRDANWPERTRNCPSLILVAKSDSRPRLHDTTHEEDTITRPSTSFFCTQINRTTFLIIEDDEYDEQPHIYIKIYPDLVFISDTGCNRPRRKNQTVTSLRQYLETYPAAAHNDEPLNPNGSKPYLILCTHCHYDHILGIPPFLSSPPADVTILASAHSKAFIEDDLPTHSLCKDLHIRTPRYRISHWARHLEYLSYTPLSPPSQSLFPSPSECQSPSPPATPLRIQLLHIPGHTPDSLAWYDIDAHHLYIGDMFYARKRSRSAFPNFPLPPITNAAIIFPLEGNWIDYMSSLSLLLSFIRHQNSQLLLSQQQQQQPLEQRTPPPRVTLSAGLVTFAAPDAEHMTASVRALFERIIAGKTPVRRSEVRGRGGEVFDYWCEVEEGEGDGEGEDKGRIKGEGEGGVDGDGKTGGGEEDGEEAEFSVWALRRLVEEARRHFYGNENLENEVQKK